MFMWAYCLSLPQTRWTQSIPSHTVSLMSVLILSFHLCLGLNGLCLSGFPTKALCGPLIFCTCAICPIHLILRDFTTQVLFGEEYNSWGYPLCSILQSSVTSSRVGPNIFLTILFCNTPSLCTSLSMRDQVSHP